MDLDRNGWFCPTCGESDRGADDSLNLLTDEELQILDRNCGTDFYKLRIDYRNDISEIRRQELLKDTTRLSWHQKLFRFVFG